MSPAKRANRLTHYLPKTIVSSSLPARPVALNSLSAASRLVSRRKQSEGPRQLRASDHELYQIETSCNVPEIDLQRSILLAIKLYAFVHNGLYESAAALFA